MPLAEQPYLRTGKGVSNGQAVGGACAKWRRDAWHKILPCPAITACDCLLQRVDVVTADNSHRCSQLTWTCCLHSLAGDVAAGATDATANVHHLHRQWIHGGSAAATTPTSATACRALTKPATFPKRNHSDCNFRNCMLQSHGASPS